MYVSTENKKWWCEHGERLEKEFISLAGPQFAMNPDKTDDKYTHDLVYNGKPADLKSIRTPFFTAGKYGYDPSRTVSFNLKDLRRYQANYPDITVIYWVVWPAQDNYGVSVDSIDGVWAYTLDEIGRGTRQSIATVVVEKTTQGMQKIPSFFSYATVTSSISLRDTTFFVGIYHKFPQKEESRDMASVVHSFVWSTRSP